MIFLFFLKLKHFLYDLIFFSKYIYTFYSPFIFKKTTLLTKLSLSTSTLIYIWSTDSSTDRSDLLLILIYFSSNLLTFDLLIHPLIDDLLIYLIYIEAQFMTFAIWIMNLIVTTIINILNYLNCCWVLDTGFLGYDSTHLSPDSRMVREAQA